MGFQVLRNKPLRVVSASETRFAENGFRFIQGTKSLEVLRLHEAGVSDLGCKVIAAMKSLREVNVSNNPGVSDRGVALLATLPNLESLELSDLKNVSDAGVKLLIKCKQLKSLRIANTSCTPQVAAFLKQPAPTGLPDLMVLGP
jgi:hypothetical protein